MATIINSGIVTKFAGDVGDMLISSADTILFELLKGSTLILKESYSPANGTIRIGGLSAVLDTCLYGELLVGIQSNMVSAFSMKIDGAVMASAMLYASHQTNTLDRNGRKKVLSHCDHDVCYPGHQHLLTLIGTGTARLYSASGQQLGSVSVGNGEVPVTIDGDPAALFASQYANGAYIEYTLDNEDGHPETFRSHIDARRYADATLIRFLNMYDAPETLLVKSPLEVKPNFSDSVGTSYGTRNRYSINPTDEYTAVSGRLASMAEYLLWRDFSMSRKAEVLHEGEWYPIVVTKPNFTRLSGGDNLGEAKVSFQMAKASLMI